MKINGKTVSSGTIVIAPGQMGEIDLPSGSIQLDFQTDSGAQRVDLVGGKLVFYNSDNVLGSAVNPTISGSGSPFSFSAVVYTIGDAPNVYRVVHYTA